MSGSISPDHAPVPSSPAERVQFLDALRGIALFGVLWVNMLWFATGAQSVSDIELEALSTARIDRWVSYVMQYFVLGKANTLFAFLFGVSFAIQMARLEQRSSTPYLVYCRRLLGLLAIGVAHLLGVWEGEILHVYAVAGFAVMLTWRWRTGTLLAAGLVLAIIAHPLLTHWLAAAGIDPLDSPEAKAARLEAFQHGSYWAVIHAQWLHMWEDRYLITGFVPWVLYALGRFMLGLVVLRQGYLTEPERHLGKLRTAALVTLPIGLACSMSWWIAQHLPARAWTPDAAALRTSAHFLVPAGLVLMTAGYVALAALAWNWDRVRPLLAVFAPLGQTALTNYLMQSAFNSAVFFGYGFGLVGRAGATACLVLSVGFFAAQVIASRLWLARYQFGPVEWLWRWWTYGQRPRWGRVGISM